MTTQIVSSNTTGTYAGTHTGVVDTYNRQSSSTSTNGSATIIEIASYSAGNVNHGFLEFDIPAAPGGETFSAAAIKLYVVDHDRPGAPDNEATTIDLHRCLRVINGAQLTWEVYSTGNNWATLGGTGTGDMNASADASGVVRATNIGSFISIDVTSLMTTLLGESATKFRVLIKRDNDAAVDFHYTQFRSSEGTDGQRPALEIDYTAGGGGGGTNGSGFGLGRALNGGKTFFGAMRREALSQAYAAGDHIAAAVARERMSFGQRLLAAAQS